MENNYVVIMAGGVGSRFWPYSRANKPKQFLDVLGIGSSLLRMTYERFLEVCPSKNIFVVTNSGYYDLVKEHVPELSDDQILLEPNRRNTAPCIAYAAYKIREKNKNANIVVAPSDHVIFKENIFVQTIKTALKAASKDDKLITLGIKPTRPETGYGYIQYIEADSEIKKVKTFTEKPEQSLAVKFFESGDFLWNAGIFVWNVNTIIKAFENHLPDIYEIFTEGVGSYYTDKENEFIQSAYSQCKNISIDYGILEKSQNVYVVLGDFKWSDLGSWSSLHDIRKKDENNNVINSNAITYESKDCVILGSKDKLIVVQGLENKLVADVDNVLLICDKDDEKRIRTYVADAKNKMGEDYI